MDEIHFAPPRNAMIRFSCKYKQIMVSHGFQVVQARMAVVWLSFISAIDLSKGHKGRLSHPNRQTVKEHCAILGVKKRYAFRPNRSIGNAEKVTRSSGLEKGRHFADEATGRIQETETQFET